MAILVPNTPFSDGDDWTPELAELAMVSPQFTGQTQYKGHRGKLTTAEIEDAFVGRVSTIEDNFRVSHVSALTVNYKTGKYLNWDGNLINIASNNLVVPDNTTSYVYVTQADTVVVGTQPTSVRVLLARVVAAGGVVTLVEDLRRAEYLRMSPIAKAIILLGGSNATDYTCTANEVLSQGTIYCRDFVIPSGVAVSVTSVLHVKASRNIQIDGTLTVVPLPNGLSPQNYNVTPFALVAGTRLGTGDGNSGNAYQPELRSFGSSGGEGAMTLPTNTISASSGYTGRSGSGGGRLWLECAGNFRLNGSIIADGERGYAGGNNFPNGGEGLSNAAYSTLIGGSGGGSGAYVKVVAVGAVSFGGSAVISVKGGNGGNGFSSVQAASTGYYSIALGGNAGSGGYIDIYSPSINVTGLTAQLTGGTPGNIAVHPGGVLAPNNGANGWIVTPFSVNEIAYPGGAGGGFAGSQGNWTLSRGGTNNETMTITRALGASGLLRTFPYLPIGG